MHRQICEAVANALCGSQKVRITFLKEATNDVNYLLGMRRQGIITIDDASEMQLMTDAHSGEWENDKDRTVTVTLTKKFDHNQFVGRMYKALEKIEVVN